MRPENNLTETEHVECYPIPSYVKEEGREEGYYPDCSIAYIRFLWKEFEPREGEYNYAFIEDILDKTRANGQVLMLRLMPHSTRESDDVPDWVKERIECPARPAGAREKESPRDPEFLRMLGRAITQLGERFDRDPTLAFLDISLPGAWGEGSSLELFLREDIEAYVDAYTAAFPNTVLIGQNGSPWIVRYGEKTAPIGWRADGVGSPEHMQVYYPPRVLELADVWRRAPVSFEAYWWLGEWERRGWNLDDIIEKTLSWHISHFNAKSLPIPPAWREKVDAWIAKMGYHFVIDEAEADSIVRAGESLSLSLLVDNVGVAPLYHFLPLYVRLKRGESAVSYKTEIDARKWIEGKYRESIPIPIPKDLPCGEYVLSLGLGGGDYPSALFASDAERDGDDSVLFTVTVTA